MKRTHVLAALVLLCGCAGADRPSGEPAPSVPFTGPASELAPSQLAFPTVVPPSAPGRCEAAAVAISARLGDGGPDAPALVVTFRNEGAVECEVDLGRAWARAHDIEPSVWLAPGATAELWGDGSACGGPAEWPLAVNGAATVVPLPAGAPCEPVATAFFRG